MREIKFRAWDVVGKKWLKEFCVMQDGEIGWNPKERPENVLQIELMQFTGLKDKNGKEIYEGDTLQQKKASGQRFRVEWNPDGKWWLEEIPYETYDEIWRWAQVTEIIGNIYENPELSKTYEGDSQT